MFFGVQNKNLNSVFGCRNKKTGIIRKNITFPGCGGGGGGVQVSVQENGVWISILQVKKS